jgi:BlaI family penicillinase repressor
MSGTRLTDAEWKVMEEVWQDPPVTARRVCDQLAASTSWAYTTVKTMLDRLVGKGVLSVKARGVAREYTPRLTRDAARRDEVDALRAKAFGGRRGSLVHFLLDGEDLTPRDRKVLERLLEDAGEGPAPEGRS